MTPLPYDRAVVLYREETEKLVLDGEIDREEANRRLDPAEMLRTISIAISVGLVARA